jgi:thioredoxin-like negative regulator of GroEL
MKYILLLLLLLTGCGERIEVLAFSYAGCKPCVQAMPELERLASEGVPIRYITFAEHPELFEQYDVKMTPTYIVVENGQEVSREISVSRLRMVLRFLFR